MNLLFKILLSAIICCFFSVNSYSQNYSTPLEPETDRNQKEIGAFVGMGQNMQQGDMYVECPECTFKGGTKFGYTFGLLYEQDLFKHFKIGASVSYDFKGFQSRFQEIEARPLTYQFNGQDVTETVNYKFRHTADVDLSFLTFSPYVKYEPWNFFFIRAGLGFALNLNNNVVHTKELDQRTVKLMTGQTRELEAEKYIKDSEMRNFKSFQMFFSPAVGFTIPFSKSVFFSPIFQYDIPLTILTDYGQDLRTSSWRLLFELRVALRLRTN